MSLNTPLFTKINEPFVCLQCGHSVPKCKSTCRDHCPKCLYSLHVDNNPGDRNASCGGLLRPLGYSKHPKKNYRIHYECLLCGAQKVNQFVDWDAFEVDDFSALLRLPSL